ncbi:10283_t:CDS:1 [Ambispora leptoticha]|uniref:10283_t:CDS:1 n=1 Tax=Ambispora leptoticha TaxID=144679 RepID=A0A9N9C9K3_9GLOM|nr:10283_t:CDS:1 [Ambispora leptoticha]
MKSSFENSRLYKQITLVILFYTLLTSQITAVATYRCSQEDCLLPPNLPYYQISSSNQNLDNSVRYSYPSLADQTQPLSNLIPTPSTSTSFSKYSGKATYYNPGLGACGVDANDNSMVVAISAPNFDPMIQNGNPNKNTLCGKRVRIYYGDKFVDGVVADRCPVCKLGDIDLSPAMFSQLTELERGFITVEWGYL